VIGGDCRYFREVRMATRTGTPGNDGLSGTAFSDILRGLGGDDRLRALGSADELDGGTGADQMTGGAGDDLYLVDNRGDRVIEGAIACPSCAKLGSLGRITQGNCPVALLNGRTKFLFGSARCTIASRFSRSDHNSALFACCKQAATAMILRLRSRWKAKVAYDRCSDGQARSSK
jgi:Ca2+-binding RTX toxin-like protein